MNDAFNLPTELPLNLLEEYRKIDLEFSSGLYQTDPSKAFSLWNTLYKKVLEKQPPGKRYHKGGEVHNMGICKLILMSPLESLNYFILGYIEDVLSTKAESGAQPEDAPGAKTLENIFHLTNEQFNLIKSFVVETIGEKGLIQNPKVVLNKLDKSGAKKSMEKEARKFHPTIKRVVRPFENIPGKWEERVFVGGDYVDYFYVINMLKPLISINKYIPIIPYEFEKPDEMSIREHSLLLLHNCKHAMFDISGRGGHLMEIERIFDYQTKAAYVCLKGERPTAMLDHIKDRIYYFKDIDNDLPSQVSKLLSSFKTTTKV